MSSSFVGLTDPEQSVQLVSYGTDGQSSSETDRIINSKSSSSNDQCNFDDEPDPDTDTNWGSDAGSATILNEILNLVKNIVGSGGLSLPGGIAVFANNPSALIPSTLVILIMGLLNAYSFSLLGRVCDETKSKTYQEEWDKTVGRRYGTKYNVWVGLVVTLKAVFGCWFFSIVIASTCQPLLKLVGLDTITKSETLLGITILVLLPLCLLQRLSSLAAFSVIGQLGTLSAATTMSIRYFDGTYKEGGLYYQDLSAEYLPSFGDKGAMAFFTPQSLIFISVLSTGYVAHYNAPKYYYELVNHTPTRFDIVVNISFVLSAVTYMCISSLGFLTFGGNSAGYILDNYSYRDPWATLSRFGIALSVIFAYPLLFQGGRDGLWDLLEQRDASVMKRQTTSVILLMTITLLAIYVPDLTFVLSFGGATLSSTVIYIFPPLMFQALVFNCPSLRTSRTGFEIKQSWAMFIVGAVLGICGAVVSVAREFF